MVHKSVFTLLLVCVTYGSILCQDAKEPSLGLDFEGSGDDFTDLTATPSPDRPPVLGNIEAKAAFDFSGPSGLDSPPVLEEVEAKTSFDTGLGTVAAVCEICSCSEEGVGDDYTKTVDCSHKELSEVPTGINETTTHLNLEFNKLVVVPKSIASLKNLKVLKINNNSIKDIEFGSISYLSELKELNLENNRLLEIPQELKNSFGLTKLKILNLNGNDIRELSVDNFSQFKQLQVLKVWEITDKLVQSLCVTLNDSLLEVCSHEKCFNCDTDNEDIPEEYYPYLPGMIAADMEDILNDKLLTTTQVVGNATTTTVSTPLLTNVTSVKLENTTEFSLRAAVDKEVHGRRAFNSTEGENEKQKEDIKVETDVQVKDEENPQEKSGGVSTLVIGLVVAAMVLVIAIVVIRKNFRSVRNTFSSSPRSANDRPGNGTAPEEMPLRDKANPV